MLPSSKTCCKNSLVSNRSSDTCSSLRRSTLDVITMPSGRVSFRALGSWMYHTHRKKQQAAPQERPLESACDIRHST